MNKVVGNFVVALKLGIIRLLNAKGNNNKNAAI
jgi:hypothetical protein